VAGLVAADAADVEAIDRAMKLGAGFPEGPAKLADDAGIERLVEHLDALADETGAARYAVVDRLRDLADEDGKFHATVDGDPLEYDTLDVERREGVGRITLDRPHRMNSIDAVLLEELDDAITRLEDDDAVRSILLTGAGDRAFSTGADLQRLAADLDSLSAVDLARRGQRTFGRLEASPLPVVAAIGGFCLGGGMELATCADLRVASRRATFGQPEHNLGLMPGWGGTQRLRHVVGEGRAREIILTAERFDAETMADYGFVTEVVGRDALDDRAFELARDLADGPPVAQALTKRAMLRGRDDTEAGLEAEAQAFGHVFGTDDAAEGIDAFASERDPEFIGE
jgi:enoyl-CoA hydratase/3-hydroxyacyl-CoA dehydrogenase